MKSRCSRILSTFFFTLALGHVAFASEPIVHVTSPANKSSVTGPVNYIASASSPDCAQGILAMRIYSAPNVQAFTGSGETLDTYINLEPGTYNTVVQAWDNCGNVGKAYVTINVTGELQPAGFVYRSISMRTICNRVTFGDSRSFLETALSRRRCRDLLRLTSSPWRSPPIKVVIGSTLLTGFLVTCSPTSLIDGTVI